MKDYYDSIKYKSESFKIIKKDKNEKEKLEMLKQKEFKLKQNKKEIHLKLPIIIKRQNEAKSQFISQYKQKELIKENNLQKQTKLNNIIENLKVRPKVEIDSERVKRITECLKIKFETKRDEADKVILFQNHGYTIDNLMTDLRYKISTALNEAGLSDSKYSIGLLNAINSQKTNTLIK